MSAEINEIRRGIIKVGSVLLLSALISPLIKADELTELVKDGSDNNIIAVRIWPSSVYTRLTIEADAAVEATSTIKDNSLVIDILHVELNQVLKTLPAKVLAEDPIIKNVVITQLDPQTVRITVALKEKINQQTKTIAPVELGSVSYKYRYVIDMYPESSADNSGLNDDLLALLQLNSNTDLEPKLSQVKNISSKLIASSSEFNGLTKYNRPNASSKILVMIDPGHGGEDPGAIGPTGVKEKNIVLDIGKKLYDIIYQTDYMRASLTRSEDIFIPLGTRVALARRMKADIFISIHADAFTIPSARGASVFMLSDKGASSSFAKWLAKTQNDADLIGGMSYNSQDRITTSVLLDMTQTWTNRNSAKLGGILLSNLGQIGKLHSQHIEKAAFAVLKAPDIPSVLIETAFISNRDEEMLLNKPDFRQKMAQMIFNGLDNFSLSNLRSAVSLS
ncbi:MAG: N-acetylmuramoyl-L-alanine amidase [Burkholderiales bacterium]|nr:N-acetylmuramoyl-L-alanine amidase [Burkholderiales bacterium]